MKPFLSVVCLAACAAAVRAAEPMTVPALSTFDGRSFAGIQLGVTTDPELKKLYRAGKGSLRPEGVLIDTTDAGIRVDALLDGRGKNARVIALYITYAAGKGDGDSDVFRQDRPGQTMYMPQRFMDVSIRLDRERGIAVMFNNERSPVRAMAALLTTPEMIQALDRRLDTRPSRVQDFRGFVRDLRDIEVGPATFSLTTRGLDLGGNRSLADRLKGVVEDNIDSRDLAVNRRATGGITGSGSANFTEGKGGNVSVNVSLAVDTPLGRYTASGSFSESIRKDERRPDAYAEDALYDGAAKAAKSALRSFLATYEKAIPRSADVAAQNSFWAFCNDATK